MAKDIVLPKWMAKYSRSKRDEHRQPTVKGTNEEDFIILHLNREAVAIECEKLINKLDESKEEEVVLSFDLNWPSNFQEHKCKTSTIHICSGTNYCSLLHVGLLQCLPYAFTHLLNHRKLRLVGNNIVNDLVKINEDFKIDTKEIISTKLLLSASSIVSLSCKHNWHLNLADTDSNKDVLVNGCDQENQDVLIFDGKIIFCNDFIGCASYCEKILKKVDSSPDKLVIGFDLEWPFSFKSGSGKVALIQLCPAENICYLFQVSEIRSLPKALIVLLNHEKVKLSGLNIKNDFRKLGRDFKIDVSNIIANNLIELNHFANDKLNCSHRWSLDRLVLNQLGKVLLKTPHIRMSDWAKNLTKEQIIYAATDAYASLICFRRLNMV